jgi:hypothetical protein
MAITRCPYCHSIIDENDKYCNNCGTQLLFTEDEEIEEEIPGEKIIDAETEEKDYTVEEPEGEAKPAAAKDLDEDIDEDLEEKLKEKTEELALDELVAEQAGEEDADDITEEVILVDEIEAADAGGIDETKKTGEKERTAELTKPEGEAEPVIEYITADHDRDDAEGAGEAAPEPVTFDTRELEGIGKTVELSKDRIDKFLEVLTEKKADEPPPSPPKEVREPTGTLPPWASTMKGAPVFPDDTGPVGVIDKGVADTGEPAGEEEVEIFPRQKDSDSTIGLPERVSQSPLPFEQGAAEEEVEEEAVEVETRQKILPPVGSPRPERETARPMREPERRAAEEEGEEATPRPPFSFSIFFKSKAFDVLFVGIFWLAALWLAAYSMGLTLFEILGSMSGPMLLLYAVFLLIYFFLFKFFLGETLGDRLFRERE